MKVLHAICYTSALWIFGCSLSIVYAFTHGEIEYQAAQAPIAHQHGQVTAADIFSAVDEKR